MGVFIDIMGSPDCNYSTRHYKPRLVYFYPIFKDHFFVFKEVFSRKFCPYVWLVFKSGLQSRAAYDGARTVYKNRYGGSLFSGYLIHPLFLGVLGAWTTFRKAEILKPLGMG
jgi:hypothetical protein